MFIKIPCPTIKQNQNKYIYVLDFDCTLTYRHYYQFIYNPKQFFSLYQDLFPYEKEINDLRQKVLNYINAKSDNLSDYLTNSDIIYFKQLIFGSYERFENLKQLLTNLKSNEELIIASRNIKHLIIKALKIVGLTHLFDESNIYDYTMNKTYIL